MKFWDLFETLGFDIEFRNLFENLGFHREFWDLFGILGFHMKFWDLFGNLGFHMEFWDLFCISYFESWNFAWSWEFIRNFRIYKVICDLFGI